jgi:pyruvate kinase
MEWLTANAEYIFGIATQVVGIAAIVATMTPNTTDNSVVDFILKIVNVLGANFGKASNDPNA